MKHLEFDIVIVGSGAGGATVASRLAKLTEKGIRIAVLEAGPHYPKEFHTQREMEMFDIFKNQGAWPTKDGTITASFGKAMGGSTLMYTGVTFKLPDHVCEEWGVDGITPEDLKPRFERLEKEINVTIPDDQMTNDNNRLFKEGCEKLGVEVERIPINVKNCEQMGFCNLGCANSNKQGTLAVQIPEAQKGGVQFIPNCVVENVQEGLLIASIGYAPEGTIEGEFNGQGSVQVNASQIILAGGTVGTSELLLRSGFQKELPAIGKYITLHPAMNVNGIFPEKIKNYKGFPKVYYTQHYSETNNYLLETSFYYPFITTKNLCLWGKDLKYAMSKYNNMMSILILLHDKAKASNQIQLDKKGNAVLDYKLSNEDLETLCHAEASAAEIFLSAGCTEVILPSYGKVLYTKEELKGKNLYDLIKAKDFVLNKVPIASAHLQGGAKMGNSAKDSVTNSWGKIHGSKNLYIADGSLFPNSSHVNPHLTIMALADRVAEGILRSYNN